MELVGHYIDHSSSNPYAMAVRSAEIKAKAPALAERDVLLVTTCLRVELYGLEREVELASPAIMNGTVPTVVRGANSVIQRLAEIAAGAHSQILGESYIAQQLVQSLELLAPASPVRHVAQAAVDIGSDVRRRHLFSATANYDKIVIDIVEEDLGSGALGETLYLVGAGMLGRSILFSGLPRRFVATRMLTRDPKALRKKLRGVVIPSLKFVHPEDLKVRPEQQSVFVVATNEVSDSYRHLLEQVIRRIGPRRIIELSSLPVLADSFSGAPEYINMYSEGFLRFVRLNNEALHTKALRVRKDIARLLKVGPQSLTAVTADLQPVLRRA